MSFVNVALIAGLALCLAAAGRAAAQQDQAGRDLRAQNLREAYDQAAGARMSAAVGKQQLAEKHRSDALALTQLHETNELKKIRFQGEAAACFIKAGDAYLAAAAQVKLEMASRKELLKTVGDDDIGEEDRVLDDLRQARRAFLLYANRAAENYRAAADILVLRSASRDGAIAAVEKAAACFEQLAAFCRDWPPESLERKDPESEAARRPDLPPLRRPL